VILGIICLDFYSIYSSLRDGTTKLPAGATVAVQGKEISRKSLLFESLFSDCYFDGDHLYISQPNASARYPLKNITEIADTNIRFNKRRVWKISVTDENGQKMTFNFWPKAYLFKINSEDFLNFLEATKKANPDAILSEWEWWKQ